MKTIPSKDTLTAKQLSNLKGWVALLRANEFPQIKGWLCLKRDGQLCYCAAGIGCKYAGVPQQSNGSFDFKDYWIRYVTKTFGVNVVENLVRADNMYYDLVGLNDSIGFSFPQIADVLEACFIEKVEKELDGAGNFK